MTVSVQRLKDRLVGGMPVNYHARYAGDVGRILDRLDEIAETNPRVRRPLQRALRDAGTEEGERMLALLLTHAYRRGDLP